MKFRSGRAYLRILSTFVATLALTRAAHAVDVRVTVRNVAASDSAALSPIILGFHNGSVDLFNAAATASAGLQNVAELGSTGVALRNEITTAQPSAVALAATATSGGFGPGILTPGAEASYIVSLDPVANRYLSFAAMVVPSNDSFIGNDNPLGIELFDAGGAFVGQDFALTGANIWDAGTEVNGLSGAAYVAGSTATDHVDENGVVHQVTDLNAQFGVYLGHGTPPGGTYNTLPSAGANLATFSFAVVPEPASTSLLGLGGVALWLRRRLRRRA